MGNTANIKRILESRDVDPVMVESINEALRLLSKRDFAAVTITRHFMEMDALELVLNLRDVNAEIPIIVVDEPYDQHYEKQIIAQPGVHYLATDYRQLADEIDALLESS